MSYLLSLLFLAACWIYPLIQTYFIFFHLDEVMAWAKLDNTLDLSNLSLEHRLVIFAIACIPMSMVILIYRQLAKLFCLYEQGILFEMENIKLIKSIGIYIIVSKLIQFIYQPLMTFTLSYYQPVGKHFIALSFGTTNFAMLVTGFVVLTASWIAEEAHELKLDAQLTF